MDNNKYLNIGIIWESSDWGGVDSYLYYLISSWPNNNDKFTIISNKNNKGLDRLKKLFNSQYKVEYIYYKNDRKLLGFFKYINYLLNPMITLLRFIFMIYKFKKILKPNQYDVILTQYGGYPGTYDMSASIIATNFLKIPVCSAVIHHAPKKPQIFMTNFSILIDRLVAKTLSSLIFVSNATKKITKKNTYLLENENDLHPLTIKNGIPNNPIVFANNDDLLIGDKKLNKFLLNIGILGRVEHAKGQEDLIFAINSLDDAIREKIHVYIIGSGSNLKNLIALSERLKLTKYITFTGFVRGDSRSIISKLDIVIVTSRFYEGFGLTIAEAIEAGKPFITTNVGALKDFKNKKLGLHIDPGRPDLIASAIENLVSDFKKDISTSNINIYSSLNMSQIYRDHFLQKLHIHHEKVNK